MIAVYIWLALTITFGIIEAQTIGLVSIWFVVGSLFALLTAAAGGALWLQIVVFIAFSALLLIITRPLAKKSLLNTTPTNADTLIGCEAVVTEDIDNLRGLGCVKIQGKFWSARSASGKMIPSGTSVTVLKIEGVKLIVELSK